MAIGFYNVTQNDRKSAVYGHFLLDIFFYFRHRAHMSFSNKLAWRIVCL